MVLTYIELKQIQKCFGFLSLFQVYTVVYKGKAKEIGAVGLEILYHKIANGTLSLDSDEMQKFLIRLIVDEKEDLHAAGRSILG